MDAIVGALGAHGVMNVDELRRAIESMEPDAYERATLLRALALRSRDDPRGKGRARCRRARREARFVTSRQGRRARRRSPARGTSPHAPATSRAGTAPSSASTIVPRSRDARLRRRRRAGAPPVPRRVRDVRALARVPARPTIACSSTSSSTGWSARNDTPRPRSRPRPRPGHHRRRAADRHARPSARGASGREGRRHARGAAETHRLARLANRGRGARLVARAWVDDDFKQRLLADAGRQRSSSASIPARRRSWSRSRTPRTCTTWSSARCARAIPERCSGRRPTGTRACPTARAPFRIRAASCASSASRSPTSTEVRVVDSTADIRYLVVPRGRREPGRSTRTLSPNSSRETR